MGKQTRMIQEHNRALEEQVMNQLKAYKKPKKEKKKKDYSYFLNQLELNKSFFVRDPKKWVSKSVNVEVQYKDFIKHCLEKYYVPGFLYNCFLDKDEEVFFPWYMCVAQGSSLIKQASNYLTRKEVNIFIKQRNNMTISYNILLSKLLFMNLDKGMAHKIILSLRRFDIIGDIDSFNYICEYFNILKNSELNNNINFGFVSDYLRSKLIAYSRNEFSLKGRTLNSLIKLSDEWHQRRHIVKSNGFVQWTPANIPDFEHIEYIDKNKTPLIWRIRQLCSSKDLFNESSKMHHCVSSYVSSCLSGQCSIFTMETDMLGCVEKLLTIEVTKNKRIVQVRGKWNRKSTNKEDSIINKWSKTF